MNRRFRPMACAATLAVSMLALTATGYAQQNQQNQQGQQQAQQNQRTQQNQQVRQGQMEYQQVRGTVVDFKRVNLRGTDQQATLVLLETQSGNRVVVDLGTERQGVRLQRGESLAVRGRPVRLGGQRVIIQANVARYGGQEYDLNRPALRQPAVQQDQGDRTRTGRQQAAMQDRDRQQAQGGRQGAAMSRFDANDDGRLDERELSRALFVRFDRNGNGSLSIQEWDRGMDRTFGEQEINLDVQRWDRDGNGRITRNEFTRAFGQSGLYDLADINGNGTVTVAEVGRLTGDARVTAGTGAGERSGAGYEQVATGLFDRFDRNRDNRVTRSEYRANADVFGNRNHFEPWDRDGTGWLSENEFRRGLQQSGLFERWDTNNDGIVSRNEWADAGVQDDGFLFFGDEDSLIGEDEGLF